MRYFTSFSLQELMEQGVNNSKLQHSIKIETLFFCLEYPRENCCVEHGKSV